MFTILKHLSVLALVLSHAYAAPLKVALILDRGGKDDKSFNSAAFRGAQEAKQKLGITLKEIEASDDSFFEPAMRSFAKKEYDLIIGIGVAQGDTMKRVAKDNPKTKFAIIDASVDSPNIASAMFAEHQGSYLVGYIAALKSKTGSIGFIGGMDIPLIRRFEKAYTQGAKAANPNIKVMVNYVGVTSEAWNNPTKAKEIASSQYQKGSDVIFVAAGSSNMGCFDAAAAAKKFAIGVDSNQNWIKPGTILTSMLKRVDSAVYQIIEQTTQNKFTAGLHYFDFKNSGIDWALDQYNQTLFSADEISKINKIKDQLIAGKIQVTDYYKTKQ